MWFVADVNWPGGALNDQMNAFFFNANNPKARCAFGK